MVGLLYHSYKSFNQTEFLLGKGKQMFKDVSKQMG